MSPTGSSQASTEELFSYSSETGRGSFVNDNDYGTTNAANTAMPIVAYVSKDLQGILGSPGGMSDPTREEIDAKLQVVEARTETRFTELNGKLDRIGDQISGLGETISRELAAVKFELGVVKSDNQSTRTTIIVVVIASVLAGMAALWTTQANLLSAFQLGLTMKSEQPAPASQQQPKRP